MLNSNDYLWNHLFNLPLYIHTHTHTHTHIYIYIYNIYNIHNGANMPVHYSWDLLYILLGILHS